MIAVIIGWIVVALILGAAYVVITVRADEGSWSTRNFLFWVTDMMKRPRVIRDITGTDPYLTRWHIRGGAKMADGSWAFDEYGDVREGALFEDRSFGLYLHRFHRSDDDRELHNHPWKWAVSLVLSGGYIEERWDPETGQILRKKVRPWRLNFLTKDSFHRVELIERDAWSLFFVGPKFASWGFLDTKTGVFKAWREFLDQKRKAA